MAAPEPSADAIAAAIDAMAARWLMGGAAFEASPEPWRAVLSDLAPQERELRLLAIAGQFAQTVLRPVPPPDLQVSPPVPTLALPPLPAELRPVFRRLLAVAAKGSHSAGALATFLAGRGVTPHPADWLPGAGDDDLPDIYAPWVAWVANARTTSPVTATAYADALTAETWDDFPPAARRLRFAALRRADPAQARALFDAKAARLPAEARARLVEALVSGLSESDVSLLEGLLNDRSDKVKEAAQRLLARLGRGQRGQDVAELAAFLERAKEGMLRRRVVVRPVALKTEAQRQRRRALFAAIDFAALAAALELSPAELAECWAFGTDADADLAVVRMAADSAPETIVAALAERAAANAGTQLGLVMILAPRLDVRARRALGTTILRDTQVGFNVAFNVAGPGLELDDTDLLLGCTAGQTLFAQVSPGVADTAAGVPAYDRMMASEFLALGLLAGPAAAAAILRQAHDRGLLAVDPRLDMLRLNAALPAKGPS